MLGWGRRSSTGVEMVEMSLIGVLFFVLLIGIVDFGQFLFVQQAMAERARSAARWGAVNDPTNVAGIRNMVLYSQPTSLGNTKASFGLSASMVNVSTADAGTDNYRLVVRVSGYSLTTFSPYLASRHVGPEIRVSVPLGRY